MTKKGGDRLYQRKKLWLSIFGVLSAAMMALIFYFSAFPAEESQEMSDGVLALLVRVCGIFAPTEEKRAALTALLALYLRKAAHFTEYTLLGCFLTLFFAGTQKTIPRAVLPALLVGIPYAGTDEWHQLFIAGRSGEWRDVLIDAAGVAFGAALACVVLSLILRAKQKRQTPV